jgi:hypothetical protein
MLPIEIYTDRKIISTDDLVNYLKGCHDKIQGLHPPMNQHEGVKACIPNPPIEF